MITYPNLYYLKYFADAVDLGSISGAAQKNLVTHPAISQAISNLERQLGKQLLDHQKKQFKVTEEGYRVAEQARLLLTAASGFNSLKLNPQEGLSSISVGVSRTLSGSYLQMILKEIRAKFPNTRVQVRFGTTNEIIQAVAKSELDLGVTIGTQNFPTLKQTVVQTGQFILVEGASTHHRESLELKSFILTEPRFETEVLKKQYQKQFGKELSVSFEIRSWEVIAQLVQQGFGVGLLPELVLKSWKKGTFRILRPSWFDCDYGVYIHYSRTPSRNHVLQHLLKILDKTK